MINLCGKTRRAKISQINGNEKKVVDSKTSVFLLPNTNAECVLLSVQMIKVQQTNDVVTKQLESASHRNK